MLVAAQSFGAEPEILPDVRRVVFLGDSITYSGQYIDYLEAYFATRFPERRIEFINLGLPSETVSGLSEPGHAGGAFPRPDLHERLARVLEKTKPDLVIACYGMNDGIYYPYGDERFQKFQDGIRRLRERVAAAKAQIIHLTPPTFDPVPLKGRTLPLGRDEYRSPYEGYNEVLDRYAAWLLQQRAQGWQVIDVHGPMNAHLAARRRETPEFLLAGDGVHASATGHLIFAQQILLAWGAPADADSATIDLKSVKAQRGRVTDFTAEANQFRFTWQTRLPLPIDPQWDARSVELERFVERLNRHRLVVTGADAARYDLFEGDTLLSVVAREELKTGLDLLGFPSLTTNHRATELLKLIHQRQRLLTDAWLTEAGHVRPGMSKGLALAEATAKAAELETQIRPLAAPATLALRFAPSAAAFPGKHSDWNGYDRYDFVVDGKPVLVVAPKQAAPGKPWVWHGEFFGHKPAPDIALLGKGFHIVYMSVPDMLGSPEAVAHWNAFYLELTGKYGFANKAALVGLSRGGLYCYNWAAANPDKVACIYADAAVCDFKSWPGGKGKGKGSPRDWQLVLTRYGFRSEAEALAYNKNPIDNLKPLANAKVPLLHVYGDADDVVPHEENTAIVAERYQKLGATITLIPKKGVGHHPHGLDDSTPIVEFIMKHSSQPR